MVRENKSWETSWGSTGVNMGTNPKFGARAKGQSMMGNTAQAVGLEDEDQDFS